MVREFDRINDWHFSELSDMYLGRPWSLCLQCVDFGDSCAVRSCFAPRSPLSDEAISYSSTIVASEIGAATVMNHNELHRLWGTFSSDYLSGS